MKRLTAFILVMILSLSCLATVSAAQGEGPNVYLNRQLLATDQWQPEQKDGEWYIPAYYLLAGMGFDLQWDAANFEAGFAYEGVPVVLKINDNVINVGGQPIELSSAPILINDRTYISLSFAEELLGLIVVTDETGAIYINEAEFYQYANDEVLTLWLQGDIETIYNVWFSDILKAAITLEEATASLTEVLTFVGELEGVLDSTVVQQEVEGVPYVFIVTDMQFSNCGTYMIAGFTMDGALISHTFEFYEGAAPQLPEGVVEEEVVIGEEFPLDAVLTMPAEYEGELKAVVLVHGSGPNDMDETVASYKFFRNLAWGLAQKGIAVLRYDKRTYTYGAMADAEDINIQWESIEDALIATEFLKADERIDASQVFLAGHSLGGKLALRIDEAGGDYKGVISMAGTLRTLWDVVIDQIEAYTENDLIKASPDALAIYVNVLDELKAVGDLKDITVEESKEMVDPISGVSLFYYKDLEEVDDYALAQAYEKPILVLQGDGDFQIYADKDFVLWQEALANNESAVFKLYENLNHLFAENPEVVTNTANDYAYATQTPQYVIDDIAEFILSVE